MAAVTLNASEFFDPDAYPLVVFKDEHHSRTDPHAHDFYELVYIDHGVALHSQGGRTQILTAGDLFLLLPGEVHGYINTHDTKLYNCLFRQEALQGLESDIASLEELGWLLTGRVGGGFEHMHAGIAERQEIVLVLEQILWERLNRTVGWALKLKSLLLSLLVIYARLSSHRRLSHDTANPNYRNVLRAVDYIERNHARELPVEEVAREAGLSAGYLSRQFRNLLGTSPSEYARNFRIAKAAERLRQTDAPIAGIAGDLGYGDVALFSRQFRQVTGTSPTGYRKNQKET